MKQITLVTTNMGKVTSLTRELSHFELEVQHSPLDIPEFQVADLRRVAESKARSAYEVLKRPLICQDAGFFLESRNGFPGVFTKFVLMSLGVDGLIELSEKNPACSFKECTAYYDGERLEIFEAIMPGVMLNERRGEISSRMWSELWLVFVPAGQSKTLAEMTDDEFEEWRQIRGQSSAVKFGTWYTAQ